MAEQSLGTIQTKAVVRIGNGLQADCSPRLGDIALCFHKRHRLSDTSLLNAELLWASRVGSRLVHKQKLGREAQS